MMAVITAFLIALFLLPFHVLTKPTLIFCFNPERAEICCEVTHFLLTQPPGGIDVRER